MSIADRKDVQDMLKAKIDAFLKTRPEKEMDLWNKCFPTWPDVDTQHLQYAIDLCERTKDGTLDSVKAEVSIE